MKRINLNAFKTMIGTKCIICPKECKKKSCRQILKIIMLKKDIIKIINSLQSLMTISGNYVLHTNVVPNHHKYAFYILDENPFRSNDNLINKMKDYVIRSIRLNETIEFTEAKLAKLTNMKNEKYPYE